MPWERWDGGRVWVAKDGRRTYYGEVGGKMVSTRKGTEEEALAELYRLNLGAGTGPQAPFSDQLVERYLAKCLEEGIDRETVNGKRRHLQEWGKAVGPRRVTLALLNQVSARMTGRRNKVSSLKAYFTWLRQQGVIARSNDPTLDLEKPQAPSRDWDRLVPKESYEAVLKVIEPRWADLLVVLNSTGLHVSELLRFCREGQVDGDVVLVKHKSGEPHRVRVSAKVAAAARRSLEAGPFSRIRFYRAVRDACDRAKVPRFGVGGFRHTVATYAVEQGASPEDVARFLGHKSSYMVKTIYAKTVVPKAVPVRE